MKAQSKLQQIELNHYQLVTWRRNVVFFVPFIGIFIAASLTLFGRPSPKQQAQKLIQSRPSRKELPLKLVSSILLKVREDYIQPELVDPVSMFKGAMDALEKSTPEIIVQLKEGNFSFKIGDKRHNIPLNKIKSLLGLYEKLREVFTIIGSSIENTDMREMEYTAINGMFKKLDPHTSLLSPEMYSEIKAGTRGSFTGIGIVVTLKDGYITVISSIDDTPAARAGIKAGDRIVRIGNVSTVNVTLNEAVKLLRGDGDARAVIYIERKGLENQIRFDLDKAVIHLNSVSGRILSGNIGYIRIKQFTQTTTDELRKQLAIFSERKVKGLILDLYNNPGGLLKQATSAAGLFLDKGTIYSTVSRKTVVSETKFAVPDDTLYHGPMVTLLNNGSASASEILAGALKHHKRTLVIGKRSFGKGSIQIVSENFDGSALKMTVAHYLSIGKYSIHKLGIEPHVEVNMVKYSPDSVIVSPFLKKKLMETKEKNPVPGIRDKKPFFTLNILDQSPEVPGDGGSNSAPSDVVDTARKILLKFHDPVKEKTKKLRDWLLEESKAQMGKLMSLLGNNGTDWSKSTNDRIPDALEMNIRLINGNFVRAGENLKLVLEISNLGTVPAHRVFVKITNYSRSEVREIILGRVDPGDKISREISFKVSDDTPPMLWPMKFVLFNGGDVHISPKKISMREYRIEVVPSLRPYFKLHYHFMDDVGGNGDGLSQAGERIRIRVMIENEGPGNAGNTSFELINETPLKFEILKGRFSFNRLMKGETRNHDFFLKINQNGTLGTGRLKLIVKDRKFGISIPSIITFPIRKSGPAPMKTQGLISFGGDTVLRDGPDAVSNIIGIAKSGSTFNVSGSRGKWIKIILHPERSAFVPTAEGQISDDIRNVLINPRWIPYFQIEPPVITVKKLSIFSRKEVIPFHIVVKHSEHIQDVYVERINGKKYRKLMFFSGHGKAFIEIDSKINIIGGLNKIKIVARTMRGISSIYTQYVYLKK
ncbi:MAG: PDZ domain-containing protein [Deltaproteobacteria bacterium]|nr:PDZ domain-containing protein [Deltaproteobacteria bacterium]